MPNITQIMAEAPIDLDLAEELRASPSVVSQSGPLLPPRQKTRATKLWKHFERTPPLGQTGPGSSNPFALCTLCPSGTAVKFRRRIRRRPKGSSGLMIHLLKCKGISSDQMIEAHAIAKEEAITYDGKPEHLDSFEISLSPTPFDQP